MSIKVENTGLIKHINKHKKWIGQGLSKSTLVEMFSRTSMKQEALLFEEE